LTEIRSETKEFLDEKVAQYNHPRFVEADPVAIPHRYDLKEDIEIAGFLAATISWGNRKMIVQNGFRMMELMGNSPYDFVMSHREQHLERLEGFVHRTFNPTDLRYFIQALKYIYSAKGGLEVAFATAASETTTQSAITRFKKEFFTLPHPARTLKHLSDPANGSAAKRINMFLRWMIRNDGCGVDFGLWKSISPHQLSCPLDLHSGNVARKLGLLTRNQNDAKALAELDSNLRLMDRDDPVKYDFALFGLGIFEKF